MAETINLKIVIILTMGFGFASILGYLANRVKLSPIVGYIFAGYLIGPYSPGYIADMELAEQLAEIGVILMMFGVGMHFKWQDLWNTRHIAITGAIGQTLFTTIMSAALVYYIGWSLEAGIIFGLAMGVASTVVLVRVLSDNNLLKTPEGHIAVGWLIVEDIITIIALLVIPLLVHTEGDAFPVRTLIVSFGIVFIKFVVFTAIMFTLGSKVVSYILSKVMLTESHELFTLTVLAITFVITAGSALLLGTSIVLGAFIAGMVIAQTGLRQQVTTTTMAIKDAFVVIFFLSIGMLFDAKVIVDHSLLFIGTLAIILIVKPIIAYLITVILKYPVKTAITVAVALAQIGEFSFILAEEADKLDLLPDVIYDIIVAGAIVSISINPLFFRWLKSRKLA